MIDKSAAREALLPTAQRAAYLAGRASAGHRMLPSLLIAGAQRCGTTSMYQALRQHPDAFRPVARKGVHYFDDAVYERGMRWYRAHFPLTATARRHVRRTGRTPIAYESSPYYLFHPDAARRIAADLPDVRVLVLLRDPVERAYSAYTHETARGYESEPFERAIELEDERLAGEEPRLLADPAYVSHAHRHQAYVSRGRYVDQVIRLVDALGPERVLVEDADEFFADPQPVWEAVLGFAGLDASAASPHFRRHNARPRSSLPPALRERLRAGYDDSDARLAAWWGRTPSWRR